MALIFAHRVRQAVLEHSRLVGRVSAENAALRDSREFLTFSKRILFLFESDVRLTALAKGLAAILAQLVARNGGAWREHKRLRPLAQLAQLIGFLALDDLVHLLL